MGREDKAEETLNLLDVLAPKVLKLRYHLARLLLEQGNILDAHRWALRNLEGDRSPSSHELLGVIHLREGRLGEAEEQFKYSLHLVPTWIKLEAEAASRSRLHLARMAFERGDIKTMGQHLWLVSAPDIRIIPDYSFLSGVFEYRSGHATSAVGLLEKALTALPENTQYANALGFVLVETELDIERGKSILEGAYRRLKTLSAPPPALILDTAHSLGIAYWKSGDVARAKELLFLAYQQTPAEMEALKTSRKADLDRLASPATATPEAPK
jgi:tetratricopeptide (TPR) repeat protein